MRGNKRPFKPDGETTRPSLLRRVQSPHDCEAWREFQSVYQPLLELWYRRAGLNVEDAAELTQRVWLYLSRRMISYQYDASRSFRGWLWRVFESRRRAMASDPTLHRFLGLDRLGDRALCVAPSEIPCDDTPEPTAHPPRLIREAEAVQTAVKARVTEQTWMIFWLSDIESIPLDDVRRRFHITYAAAFAARKRVRKYLREEGERRMPRWGAGQE